MGTKQHSAIVGANLHVTKDNSVGPPQLQVDAVETISIKDENVTEPKLETDFLRKYLAGRQVFYDDFLGAVLDNRWAESGDPGGSAIITTRSKLLLATNVNIGDKYRINWNGKQGIYVGKLPKFYARVTPFNVVHDTYVGLKKDANNLIWFGFETGVSVNWRAYCILAGVPTVVDTGIPMGEGVPAEFYIDVVSVGEVKFWIDGALVATINTNIPATSNVEPWFEVEADVSGSVSLAIDNVIISINPE